jgi:hypothetical protein
MKLEVGMYVRTKTGIEQIYKIDNNKTKYKYLFKLKKQDGDGCIDCGVLSSEDILKASHNIIDLIEVGDVIIDEEGHKYPINYEFETDYNDEYKSYEITIDDRITLFFKDGLSIVTKEQMEAMQYKVV